MDKIRKRACEWLLNVGQKALRKAETLTADDELRGLLVALSMTCSILVALIWYPGWDEPSEPVRLRPTSLPDGHIICPNCNYEAMPPVCTNCGTPAEPQEGRE
jgi:hypothetical protein